ncbi:hypothetical protein QQX98_000901 [Neonectria punicea]|uniref:HNH nuclease domain-containing protein n=1 Tax=Neonectria punicea TaxID=979145 RepID=A0ABR1HRQ8_9HYPO
MQSEDRVTRQKGRLFQPDGKLFADIKSQVHIFNPELAVKGEDKSRLSAQPDFMYSPKPKNLGQIVYYIEISITHFDDLFSEIKSDGSVFISALLLRCLSEGDDDNWMRNGDGSGYTEEKDDLEWLKSDDKWEEFGQQHTLEIPVRQMDGTIVTATLPWEKQGAKRGAKKLFEKPIFTRKKWKAWVKKHFDLPASGWSTRNADFALIHPLWIWPVEGGLTANPLEADDYEILRVCVHEVDDEREPKKWRLEYPKKDPADDDTYKLMSIDPFGMFLTYIHLEDWDRWMAEVESANNPSIRKFISKETTEMSKIMTKLSKKAVQAQASKKLNKKGNDEWIQRVEQIPGTEIKEKQAKYFAIGKYLENAAAMDSINYTENGVTMAVHIDAKKIKDARGKRKKQKNQEQVMCDVGAPAIAASLGWSKMVYSSNSTAEWLHLVGFAYGGLLNAGVAKSWETSQIPYNLVFGTSETNSLMTRYETAWQEFMTREDKLRALLNAAEVDTWTADDRPVTFEPPKAMLMIQTNKPDSILDYDLYNSQGSKGKQYSTDQYDLWGNDKVGGTIKQGLGEDASIGAIHTITKKFFFITHTIDYEFRLDGESYILPAPGFSQTVSFYPFMRPLLHSAETALDRKIMSFLYLFARQRLALHRVDLYGRDDVDFENPDTGEEALWAKKKPAGRTKAKGHGKTKEKQEREANDDDGEDGQMGNAEDDPTFDRDKDHDTSLFDILTKKRFSKK